MKRFCECGNRIKVFRRVRKPGKWRGKIKVFSDKYHDLCARRNNREHQRRKAIELEHYGDHKTSAGIEIIVDDENFGFLNRFTWSLRKCSDRFYAVTAKRFDGEYEATFMHRLILNAPKNMVVDHVNGNPLDNRIANLRICTKADNGRNRKPNNGQRFKGVIEIKSKGKNPRKKRYHAQIFFAGKSIHLGYHETEEDAARHYDKRAIELFGEFANLNFPKQENI